MSRHVLDHQSSTGTTGAAIFLRLVRDRGQTAWKPVWQRPFLRAQTGRRLVEFIRIGKSSGH